MPQPRRPRTPASPSRLSAARAPGTFSFRLCVTGMSPRSRAAIVNLRVLCETHLAGRYELEIIDLYQRPELARRHHVVATPTLIREQPRPIRRLLGSLSDGARALQSLGIVPRAPQ